MTSFLFQPGFGPSNSKWIPGINRDYASLPVLCGWGVEVPDLPMDWLYELRVLSRRVNS